MIGLSAGEWPSDRVGLFGTAHEPFCCALPAPQKVLGGHRGHPLGTVRRTLGALRQKPSEVFDDPEKPYPIVQPLLIAVEESRS